MNQPRQNPPVDRLYMRSVVGRQAPPDHTETGRKGAKAAKSASAQPHPDYVIGLTTFHIRPRGTR